MNFTPFIIYFNNMYKECLISTIDLALALNKQHERVYSNFYNNNPNPERIFVGEDVGDMRRHGNNFPVPNKLHLKVGSTVRICYNDPDGGYVNGMVGTIVDMNPLAVTVDVDGKHIKVTAAEWEMYEYYVTEDGYTLILSLSPLAKDQYTSLSHRD